jgi:hypothetical protein
MKNRLPDPSEICALELKAKIGKFGLCLVSATIAIDRPIFSKSPSASRIRDMAKNTVRTARARDGNSFCLAEHFYTGIHLPIDMQVFTCIMAFR